MLPKQYYIPAVAVNFIILTVFVSITISFPSALCRHVTVLLFIAAFIEMTNWEM